MACRWRCGRRRTGSAPGHQQLVARRPGRRRGGLGIDVAPRARRRRERLLLGTGVWRDLGGSPRRAARRRVHERLGDPSDSGRSHGRRRDPRLAGRPQDDRRTCRDRRRSDLPRLAGLPRMEVDPRARVLQLGARPRNARTSARSSPRRASFAARHRASRAHLRTRSVADATDRPDRRAGARVVDPPSKVRVARRMGGGASGARGCTAVDRLERAARLVVVPARLGGHPVRASGTWVPLGHDPDDTRHQGSVHVGVAGGRRSLRCAVRGACRDSGGRCLAAEGLEHASPRRSRRCVSVPRGAVTLDLDHRRASVCRDGRPCSGASAGLAPHEPDARVGRLLSRARVDDGDPLEDPRPRVPASSRWTVRSARPRSPRERARSPGDLRGLHRLLGRLPSPLPHGRTNRRRRGGPRNPRGPRRTRGSEGAEASQRHPVAALRRSGERSARSRLGPAGRQQRRASLAAAARARGLRSHPGGGVRGLRSGRGPMPGVPRGSAGRQSAG